MVVQTGEGLSCESSESGEDFPSAKKKAAFGKGQLGGGADQCKESDMGDVRVITKVLNGPTPQRPR